MCESMTFIPKPFVFEDMVSVGLTKVYLPGQSLYAPYTDKTPLNDSHACVCVHLCDQFATYPIIGSGIRCIPKDATCKFGGRCHGSRILINGEPTNKSVDLNYQYVMGLGKTR